MSRIKIVTLNIITWTQLPEYVRFYCPICMKYTDSLMEINIIKSRGKNHRMCNICFKLLSLSIPDILDPSRFKDNIRVDSKYINKILKSFGNTTGWDFEFIENIPGYNTKEFVEDLNIIRERLIGR